MSVDDASLALDERLQRLADLHTGCHLSAQEFTDAKRLVLAPSTASPVTTGQATAEQRRVAPIRWRWWAVLLVGAVLGFMVACVAAAVTSLQRPAGPVLCRGGRLLAGNVIEHSVGATGYNIHAVCAADDGTLRSLSQVQVIGVLWLEYTLAWVAVISVVLVIWRAVHGSRRADVPLVVEPLR